MLYFKPVSVLRKKSPGFLESIVQFMDFRHREFDISVPRGARPVLHDIVIECWCRFRVWPNEHFLTFLFNGSSVDSLSDLFLLSLQNFGILLRDAKSLHEQ